MVSAATVVRTRLSGSRSGGIWAGRPIFRGGEAQSLDGEVSHLNTGRVRVCTIAAALVVSLAAPATSWASLQSALEQALRVPHVSLASTGAIAVDLTTGETVYSRNATLSLLPASNEKLAVTYAALTALGPAFRIETDVLGEGTQAGTTWRRGLVLKGDRDPTRPSAGLPDPAARGRAPGGAPAA